MPVLNIKERVRENWVRWLKTFGVGRFYDAFVQNAQDARGTCKNCRQSIYLDITEGGGVPDWRTKDGDYGCEQSPDTIVLPYMDMGCGSHEPIKLTSQRRSS